MTDRIYLDHAASAPLDPEVAETIARINGRTGNPSSVHAEGRGLRAEIDRARRSVAALIGAEPQEVTFTSGATESNATAIMGLYRAAVRGGKPLRVLLSPFEHPSVSAAASRLAEEEGAIIDVLPAEGGVVSAEDVGAMIREDTVIVAVMWVNNVIGTVQPVSDIGTAVASARKRRGSRGLPLWFFSDAVQAVGNREVNPRSAGIDALSFSAHKIGGPKGVGALYVRNRVVIEPLIDGGGQEGGMRGGTENAAGIAGFGRAAELLALRRAEDVIRFRSLRSRLVAGLGESAPTVAVFDREGLCTSPHVVYVIPQGSDGEAVAMRLDVEGIAVSTGSACEAGKRGVDPAVVAAFGAQRARRGGIRVSIGRSTTEEEVDRFLAVVARVAS